MDNAELVSWLESGIYELEGVLSRVHKPLPEARLSAEARLRALRDVRDRVTPGARAPAREPLDEEHAHFLDANDNLGLAKPRAGATWDVREVLERAHAVVDMPTRDVVAREVEAVLRRVDNVGLYHLRGAGGEHVNAAVLARVIADRVAGAAVPGAREGDEEGTA